MLNNAGWWGYLHPELWVAVNVAMFGIAVPLALVYLANWWNERPR